MVVLLRFGHGAKKRYWRYASTKVYIRAYLRRWPEMVVKNPHFQHCPQLPQDLNQSNSISDAPSLGRCGGKSLAFLNTMTAKMDLGYPGPTLAIPLCPFLTFPYPVTCHSFPCWFHWLNVTQMYIRTHQKNLGSCFNACEQTVSQHHTTSSLQKISVKLDWLHKFSCKLGWKYVYLKPAIKTPTDPGICAVKRSENWWILGIFCTFDDQTIHFGFDAFQDDNYCDKNTRGLFALCDILCYFLDFVCLCFCFAAAAAAGVVVVVVVGGGGGGGVGGGGGGGGGGVKLQQAATVYAWSGYLIRPKNCKGSKIPSVHEQWVLRCKAICLEDFAVRTLSCFGLLVQHHNSSHVLSHHFSIFHFQPCGKSFFFAPPKTLRFRTNFLQFRLRWRRRSNIRLMENLSPKQSSWMTEIRKELEKTTLKRGCRGYVSRRIVPYARAGAGFLPITVLLEAVGQCWTHWLNLFLAEPYSFQVVPGQVIAFM